jgi:uncharacterized protein (TIGR02118 family)
VVRFVALWSKPEDVEGFERHYREVHMRITARWPGVRSSTVTRFTGSLSGADAPYHLMFVATLDSEADLAAMLKSEAVAESGRDAREMIRRYGVKVTMLTGADVSPADPGG